MSMIDPKGARHWRLASCVKPYNNDDTKLASAEDYGDARQFPKKDPLASDIDAA